MSILGLLQKYERWHTHTDLFNMDNQQEPNYLAQETA